jgi:hypothetical protein
VGQGADIRKHGAPRYIVALEVVVLDDLKHRRVSQFLRKERLAFDEDADHAHIYVRFEKTDPEWPRVLGELRDLAEFGPIVRYEPAFDPTHLAHAEWLHLLEGRRVTWMDWSGKVGLERRRPRPTTNVGADFGIVYLKPDTVISERLSAVLLGTGTTGWQSLPLSYCTETDGRVRLHYLIVTNRLPGLAGQTELDRQLDPVTRQQSVFQQGLLVYRRSDLGGAQDFNLTLEAFGPSSLNRPGLVISQRAWRILLANHVEPFDVEPVVVDSSA